MENIAGDSTKSMLIIIYLAITIIGLIIMGKGKSKQEIWAGIIIIGMAQLFALIVCLS